MTKFYMSLGCPSTLKSFAVGLSKGHSWFDKLTTNGGVLPISPNGNSGMKTTPWGVPRIFCTAIMLLLIVDSAQAAVAFRAAANNGQSSTASGGTITVSKPTGTISGDVMLASVAVVTNTSTVTAPTGWNLVQNTNQTSGNTSRLYTYYKVAGAAEPASYAWTFTGANVGTVVGIASFTGVDTALPIDASASQTTARSTSHTALSVTPTVAGDMLVTIHSYSSSRNWAPPGGMTERVDRRSEVAAGNEGVSMEMNTEPRSGTGATGTRTAVTSGSPDRGATHSIALKALPVVVTPGGFNAFETSTPANAIIGVIQTKVSAQTFSLDIVALNTATPPNAVLTTFTGAVKVEVLNARDNSAVLDTTTGCRSSWTVLQTLSPNPTFVAANNGRLTVAFTQNGAYKDARIRVTYPATGTPTKIGCSTDNFAIRPASFTGLTVRDADWQTAGATRNLSNIAATGGVAHKAGQPFRIDAVAQNAAGIGITYGSAAGNYDGLPEAQLASCVLPAAACTLGVLDALGAATTWTAGASAGSFFTATASYNDAGSFTMNLVDTAFSAVDASDGTPADCTASGQYICSSTTLNVGRFVPDNFELVNADSASDPLVDYTLDTWLPVAAPQLHTFNTTDATCNATATAPRRSFTYIGQPFGYVDIPQVTFKAMNASGIPINNYSGTLMKLTAAGVSQTYTAVTGTLDTTLALGIPTLALNANYTNGSDSPVVGSIAINTADKLAFTRTMPIAPFNAAITLDINVQDNSENAVAGNGIITATAPVIFSPIPFDSGTTMRFGRLKLENAHGSELLNLPISMETQYWNATTFVTNAADHCTTIVPGNVLISNPRKNLAISETGITLSGAFLNGKSTNLRLNQPSGGDGIYNGSVDICVDLGVDTPSAAAPLCIATTPANQPWLQGKWSETNYDDDPVARGTFGIYKNANEIIYMREIY